MRTRIEHLFWPMTRRILHAAYGHWRLQSFFARLHRVALRGMQIGVGDWVESSGERWLLQHLAQTFRGPVTILDVGANMGDYTAAALAAFGDRATLYAFEPAHDTAAALGARYAGNTHVQTFPYGLGASEARVPLYGDQVHSGMNSVLPRQIPAGTFTLTDQITLRPLAAVCQELGITHSHLLKIDVEGHELAVLQGAQALLAAGAVDVVQFEFGGTAIDARLFLRDFYALLTPQYTLYRLVRNGLAPLGPYRETLEIFTQTNYVAIRQGVPITTHD